MRRHVSLLAFWFAASNAGAAPRLLGGATNRDHYRNLAAAELQPLSIQKEPSPRDWQQFLRAPEALRERLWSSHTQKGHRLGSWAWQWRLGWLRACTASPKAYCQDVLFEGLTDRALVVRADAAMRMGARFEGTDNSRVRQALIGAFGHPKNLRAGRPLFVLPRIVHALHRLGPEGARAAASLAATHPALRAYFYKLAAASTKALRPK